MHLAGGIDRWQRCASAGSSPAAPAGWRCWLLWPVGLLFPAPVPLGLGQVLPRLTGSLLWALQGQCAVLDELALAERRRPNLEPLSAGQELATVALGLLAPCMVALVVAQRAGGVSCC